jgi:hypothetical protein
MEKTEFHKVAMPPDDGEKSKSNDPPDNHTMLTFLDSDSALVTIQIFQEVPLWYRLCGVGGPRYSS